MFALIIIPKYCYYTKEQDEINILSGHMNAEVSVIYSPTLKATPMPSIFARDNLGHNSLPI